MEAPLWRAVLAGLARGFRLVTPASTPGCSWWEFSPCSARSLSDDLINGKLPRLYRLQQLGASSAAGDPGSRRHRSAVAACPRNSAGKYGCRKSSSAPGRVLVLRARVRRLARPVVVVQS